MSKATETPFPPPALGVQLIRKCRSHFHICSVWPPYEDDDEPGQLVDTSGCLTFEQASRAMLREGGPR